MNKLLQRFTAALIALSIVLGPQAIVQAQTNTGTLCPAKVGVAFGFFNGVDTTRIQANRNLQEFKVIYGISTAGGDRIKYQLFYNDTGGLDDFVETFEQRLAEQNGLLAGKFELFFTAIKGGGAWWTSITQTVSEAQQILTAIVDQRQAALLGNMRNAFLNPPTAVNYQEHRSLIDNLVLEGPKLLFVAHSQGNLFANVAYKYAVTKTLPSAVGIVHIAPASPDTIGPVTLADKDLVINGLRLFGTVPAITINIPGYLLRPPGLNSQTDIKGHGLLEIYLNPALATAIQIRTNIDQTLANLAKAPLQVQATCLSVTQVPVAISPTGVSVQLSAMMNNLPVNENNFSSLWTFDDKSTSTELSPTKLFKGPGSYSVLLKITGKDVNGKPTNDSFSATAEVIISVAGRYKGTFGGTDSGTFDAVMDPSGSIRGTGFSTDLNASISGIGTFSSTGAITMTLGSASTGATFTGQVRPGSGQWLLDGTWSNPHYDPPESGTFSGISPYP